MKKTILFIAAIILTISVIAQEQCVTCIDNEINYENYASAVGIENTVWGFCSLAAGEGNGLKGDYAVAMGKQNYSDGTASFAMGEKCKAWANYSVAMGYMSEARGMTSFAMGNNAYAGAESSFAFGFLVEAIPSVSFVAGKFLKSTASGTMILGSGTSNMGDIKYLTNNVFGTMMIGFNSDLPTFFVSRSSGMGATGKIGIGNVTAPSAKLHIKADATENASLFLESSDWDNKFALIQLGTTQNTIKAEKNIGLSFFTEKDYIFNDGKVGIGTENPEAKLDVDGDIRFTGQLYDVDGLYKPSPWEHNDNGIFYSDGNIGIGTSASADQKLEIAGNIHVDGNIDFTGALLQNGQPFETTKWQENAKGLYYNDGFIGIGTDDPIAKLEVTGNIIAEAIEVDDFMMATNGYGAGKLLQSDANGIATWVDPPPTDDGDWEISYQNVYRNGGKVGIGTPSPSSDLHIKSLTGDVTTSFLEIENDGNGVFGSGSTTIGKWAGSGPFIMQKAGIGPYYSGDEGLRLAFVQNNKNNITGLSISTYMNNDGSVHYSDIYAENGWLYLRSSKELFIRSGGNSPIVFETNGDNTDQGTQRMEINRYGQVGIGTTQHDDQNTLLTVAGRIHAQEVKVTANAGGADFIFDDDYDLPGIDEVASFIKTNKHLPDIPSAEEMKTEGLDLGEMQIKLLQKIEELTLYVIDLKKENEEMKGEIENLSRNHR